MFTFIQGNIVMNVVSLVLAKNYPVRKQKVKSFLKYFFKEIKNKYHDQIMNIKYFDFHGTLPTTEY